MVNPVRSAFVAVVVVGVAVTPAVLDTIIVSAAASLPSRVHSMLIVLAFFESAIRFDGTAVEGEVVDVQLEKKSPAAHARARPEKMLVILFMGRIMVN